VSPRFTVAIVCHPKKVTQLAPEREQHMQPFLQHPRAALWEIGLDWTEPMHTGNVHLPVEKATVIFVHQETFGPSLVKWQTTSGSLFLGFEGGEEGL